jgi:hypothetical protein
MPRLRPVLLATLAALACGAGAAPPERVCLTRADDGWRDALEGSEEESGP